MLAFISFLLVTIGSLNWFCIGILQYDFVAGLFGSQSNVFSRLVYTLVGIASIIVAVNLIKNKGKFVVSFKKANKEYKEYMNDKQEDEEKRVLAKAESGSDFALDREKESRGEERQGEKTSLEDSHNENNDSHSQDHDCKCKDCDCDKKDK